MILTGFQFECFGIPASAPAYRQAEFATAFAAQAEEDAAVALGGQSVVGINFAVLCGTGRTVPCGKDDFTAQRVA